jgi:hypothetical protein
MVNCGLMYISRPDVSVCGIVEYSMCIHTAKGRFRTKKVASRRRAWMGPCTGQIGHRLSNLLWLKKTYRAVEEEYRNAADVVPQKGTVMTIGIPP